MQFEDYRDMVWIIKYQKHSLPHMYYLLFPLKDDNFIEKAQVDKIVYIELPNKKLNPDSSLIELVKTHMIHSLYGVTYLEYIYIKDKNDGYRCQYKTNYLKSL